MSVDQTSQPFLEPSLSAIVAPSNARGFLEQYWKRKVFFSCGSPGLAESLLAEMGPPSVAGLLWQSEHWAVLQPRSAEPGSARASMAAALQAYEKGGATLYCQMRSEWPLARWASTLARELGEAPIGIAAVFAVRAGYGTSPHFDWNENFTVQLLGSKTWRVAAGFMEHPISNWRMGDPTPPYANAPQPPDHMPSNAQEILLVPGSVLYVPRGHLHQATASGTVDSLSLNLSFPPTPWAVILCSLLSERLLANAKFREGLVGAFGEGWGAQQVRNLLPARVETLCQNATELGEALLGIMDDPVRLQEYLIKRKYPKY